jgi:hypothetical protein
MLPSLDLYYLRISNSVEQSPSLEANSRLASHEIPSLLWNPEVHFRPHKSLPPVLILNQIH